MNRQRKRELTRIIAPWLGLAGSAALVVALFLSPGSQMGAEQGDDVVTVSRQQIQGAVDAALAENPSLRDHLGTLQQQMHDGAVAQSLFVAEGFSQGLAATDYIVRNRMVEIQALALYAKADSQVTPEAVKAYFDENRSRYRSIPRRQILQIFVPVTNLVGDTEARARLQYIFDNSRDQLQPQWVTNDSLEKLYGPTMAGEIFKLPVDEWSAALRSGVGWHYVKVVQDDPGRQLDLDEAREQATEDCRRELRSQAYQQELSRLRAKYRVEEKE